MCDIRSMKQKNRLTEKASAFQKEILALLDGVKEYEYGSKGLEGKPTDAFWTLWRERKGVVKVAGFSCLKDEGNWVVKLPAPELDENLTLDDCLKLARVTAEENAFWNDRSNWHLVGNSKNR